MAWSCSFSYGKGASQKEVRNLPGHTIIIVIGASPSHPTKREHYGSEIHRYSLDSMRLRFCGLRHGGLILAGAGASHGWVPVVKIMARFEFLV